MDDDVRKAALLLHTLSDADRNWMFEQLPAQQRRRLLDLVDELRELGIPGSPALLDAMKDDSAAERPPAPLPDTDSWEGWCAVIERAGPSAVWPMLRTEPEPLIARVLALRDWSWAPAIAQWLDPLQRTTVRALLERGGGSDYREAQKMNEYLLSRLSERIRALRTDTRAPGKPVAPVGSGAADKPVRRPVGWQWPRLGRDRESIR
ncbi:hypothetical protein [Trinickia diaoshuihuensis]|uniref:hypothetical protein n=1 Tax=Trinickia diaoshuihuensis TaxID=2292265 RepID=UPI000E2853AF|nr:hypothetical protein [Trinickia diaoshuihuensis]